MRISTKGQNAIKLMLDLAVYSTGEPVKLKDIAKRQNISEKYLEQIISLLHKDRLVKSVRGARGGYTLYDVPERYTVGQILRAAEGSLAPTDCVGDNGKLCENMGSCVCYRLWTKLDDAISEVLDSITLADMLDWQNELMADQYVI